MTAFGTVASAVDAMKQGAADYLTKPIDLDELEVLIGRTLERRALVAENRELRRELETRYRLAGLETANARMAEAINTAARAAASRATILVRGESGTGKELLARAIHYASPRARARSWPSTGGACPRRCVETELFGHERGAFTGADRERRGRFELADGGTLFLDEIGDLPRGHPGQAAARAPGADLRAPRRHADRSRWTCGCSPRPTATSRRWSGRASSARISTTASTS